MVLVTADQIELVSMVIDHLTERGTMELEQLYESPFTGMNPLGVEGILGKDRAATVIHILTDIRSRAALFGTAPMASGRRQPCLGPSILLYWDAVAITQELHKSEFRRRANLT